MRTLFVSVGFPPDDVGGAERQAALQALGLARLGVRVNVITARNGWLPARSMYESIVVLRLPRPRVRFLGRLVYLAWLTITLLSIGRRFAVIHVHLANLQADVAVFIARMIGVPSHIKLASGGPTGEIERLAKLAKVTRWYGLRRADSVQAISVEIKESLLAIGVAPDRIVQIPNGVPQPSFSDKNELRQNLRDELGLEQERMIFVYVGRLATYKGIGFLLEAWSKANLPNATLLLVGPQAVDHPVGRIEDHRDVIVYGKSDNPQVMMAGSDVFVLPSMAEGMSNAMLEALATGLPVIATDVGAARELLEDPRCGLVVAPGSADALATALIEMHRDEHLRSVLGAAAERRAKDFSIEAIVTQLADRYRVIARR